MDKYDLEEVLREGPLPKVDDESELADQTEKSGVAKEHGSDFVTIPARGAGSYPAAAPDEADPDANPDADPEQRER